MATPFLLALMCVLLSSMNRKKHCKNKRKVTNMNRAASGTLAPFQPNRCVGVNHDHGIVSPTCQAWPRYLMAPDLMVDCLDSPNNGHSHQAHTFPLYLLSVYFHKAILFANRSARPFVDVKRYVLKSNHDQHPIIIFIPIPFTDCNCHLNVTLSMS